MLTRHGSKLEDQYPFWCYNVKDNDVIRMDYIELSVHIMGLDLKEHGLDVLRTDTIEEVKTRVMKYHKLLASDKVCLTYGDKKLDETKRPMDYNIVDGDKMKIWRLSCYARECVMSGGDYHTISNET